MIALEHNKDTNREASIRCLQDPYNLQFLKTSNNGLPDCQEGVHEHLAVDNAAGSEVKTATFDSAKELQERLSDQNGTFAWSNFYPASSNMNMYPSLEAQPHPPFAVDNSLRYVSSNMFRQPYPYQHRFQDFQYFVVIDFEATCDKDKHPHPQEIIEFPSVIVSSMSGQLEACFQTYVRPTSNQLLSDFCKDLTGIQQIQVDRGVTLGEALLRHDKWLEKKGIKNTQFAVVTWSNWDCQVMLESECRYKNIRKPPYFNRWINLKIPFREVFGNMRCNLKEAVEKAGLVWQGRPHCGLDDAKNTARLLALLMQKGFKFSITGSLTYESSTDDSGTWKVPLENHPFPSFQPSKVRNILVPVLQYHHPCCHCGVKSSKGMIRKPGPKQGSLFFGCGNWTSARGARCQYFEWTSS
ncbi:hypothetical protein Leryth_002099 [Lithospermum erythrorhizon]|nr:hypothetical protein Leryth_002099 [Lithospermum erythrorhizon]